MNTIKKLIFLSFAALGIAFMVSSCASENSVDVEQDRIWAQYELFYDKPLDKTYAKATFKFGNGLGTLLKLTAPSEVKFKNDLLLFDETFKYYVKEYSCKIDSGSFTFTDAKSKKYVNSTPVMKAIDYPALDTLKTTSSYTFTWVGTPITQNEGVSLTIDGIAQNNVEIFWQTNVGGTNMVLDANKLKNLGLGTATMYMDRGTTIPLTQKTSAGGEIIAKYRAVKTVYVK